MTEKLLTWMGLCGLALSLGCNASTMIGQVPDGSAPGNDGQTTTTSFVPVGTSGHTCAPPQFPGDHPYDLPAGTEGAWTGYVEGGTLGLSSDAVGLTLDHAADGSSQIHIVYGVAAPPPPATSATEPYLIDTNTIGPSAPSAPIEGFAYTAHNVDWQAFGQQWRLRFLIDNSEPWGSWCRLQSSYETTYPGGVEYGCLPNTGGGGSVSGPGVAPTCWLNDSAGNRGPSVSCAQFSLCLGNYVCGCDECGCDMQVVSYDGVPSGPGTYDILFDPTTASGSNLHLMRAAAP